MTFGQSTPQQPNIQSPPTIADASVAMAGQREKRRLGMGATMLTGGQGVTQSAPLAAKNLLGQ